MSGEMVVGFGLRYSKSGATFSVPNRQSSIDITSQLMTSLVQNIGTSHEALTLGDLSTSIGPGYLLNTDATNIVQIGAVVSASFVMMFEIPPGMFAFIPRVNGATVWYAKALVAACNLQFVLTGQ